MKRESFLTPNQLKRYTYFYISLFMILFLVVFMLLANLNWLISLANPEAALISKEQLEQDLQQAASDPERVTRASCVKDEEGNGLFGAIGILGSNDRGRMLGAQLDGMKQPWRFIEAGTDMDRPEGLQNLIVVAEESPTDLQIEWLRQQQKEGVHLLFLQVPSKQGAADEALFDLLGISRAGGYQTYPGMRAGEEMLLGQMQEYAKTKEEEEPFSVSAYLVRLKEQAQVFAQALPETAAQSDVWDLPPLFWKYEAKPDEGSVYVCNGSFLEDEFFYTVLPTVLEDLCGTYLYPVVNAYCLMADGFPYAQNETRESWTELYSRDAYGIQRDLLLPELQRCEARYGATATLFSPAYQEIRSAETGEMKYYRDSLEREWALLAGKQDDGYYLTSPQDPLDVCAWDSQKTLWDEESGKLRLLYQPESWKRYRQEALSVAGAAKWNGYLGFRIDVDEILSFTREEESLPVYFDEMESALGIHSTVYGWMERVTAQEAAERIYNYLTIRPAYRMTADGIAVDVQNFNGRAWFLLRSVQKGITIDHGTVTEIGENTYLVELTEDTAQITWQGREEE